LPTAADPFTATILEQCSALRNAGVWRGEPHVRPRAWLDNFEESERLVAAALLDHFVFFSDRLADLLFEAAFDSVARTFLAAGTTPVTATAAYRAFVDSAFFTRVEGERPNPTDSGNLYCRKARQRLRIAQERIVDPATALEGAIQGAPVIFVDDFVGSGLQMAYTWARPYRPDSPRSFAEAFAAHPFTSVYVCLIATEYGVNQLQHLPLRVHSAHVLSPRFTLGGFRYPSHLPSDMNTRVEKLLRKYAPLLELEPYMRPADFPVLGFRRLATAIAFEHSVPDATLPIFWARAGRDWTPLVERR
jgi:hypothetical protein